MKGGARLHFDEGVADLREYVATRMATDFQLSPGRKPSRVVFGSCVERKMFPMHHAPTRFGIEQGLRGEPHRSPGCYDPDPVMLFLKPMDTRPRSERGWYFGATSASRAPRATKGTKPGPADYQRLRKAPSKQMFKPFNTACERMPENEQSKELPGPGAYAHNVSHDRRVEFDESFGGTRSLKTTVTVKCTKGIPDQCRKCQQSPIGDYYENSNYVLCPGCYRDMQQSQSAAAANRLHGFHKVRDCRTIHKHQFPGKEPKTILMSDKEQKKLRYREAYMKLYYS